MSELCPRCDGKMVEDFDEDQGYFLRCPDCGHCIGLKSDWELKDKA